MSGIKDTIKEALGLGPKVRYGIVGLGDISQRALMPSVTHTGNSEIVALVTGDPEKAEELAKEYKLSKDNTYSYEQFDKLLASKTIDAIYLGTPNWRHAEFAIPALKAGVHVLLEKPMEVTTEKCMAILDAQKTSNAKLMIAYRLHFEPATITALEKVRSGELGDTHMFSAMFIQNLSPDNHRAQNGWKGGPLLDMGIYPLNAVRNLYGDEPIEVSATAFRHPEAGFANDLDDTTAVTLTFPNNRVAQFICSYYGNTVDELTIAGTKGSLRLSPAFLYDIPLQFAPLTIGEKQTNESFKATDHFAGELKYFSDCILKGTDPEADGEEGLADVRVLEAALRSIETKTPQKLPPFSRSKRIEKEQMYNKSAHKKPSPDDLVNAAPPAKSAK